MMSFNLAEIDVIMQMLEDIDSIFGLKPEELEIKEKIEREVKTNERY